VSPWLAPARTIVPAIASGSARRLFAVILLGWSSHSFADPWATDKGNYSIFNPTPDDDMRAFSTDRPTKSNSAYTVDAGHFQYESDVGVFGYGSSGGTQTHQWTILDPTFKMGLTNNVDAELQVTPYKSIVSTNVMGSTNVSGVGDTIVRVKANVFGNDHGPVSLALLPYVKLPTANSDLGNGKTEGGIILPMSVGAPLGFTIIVMTEGDYLKDASVPGYHVAFDLLVNVSHPLGRRWTVYSEAYTSQSFHASDASSTTLDEALSYAWTSNLQLDVGGNFSLHNASPRTQLYAGLAQRY
jgi:Putative MetA-pathway of phenol degradation